MPGRRRSIAIRRILGLLLALVCATATAVVTVPPAAAGNQGPGFVDPSTNVTLYQSLSARWWQWAFSTPDTPGGPFHNHQVDCAVNQPLHHVLFLAGPFNVIETVERTCAHAVQRGTWILVPVINTECSNRETDPRFFGATPEQRKACVQKELFNPADLSASVDGHSFPVSQSRFSVVSRDFPFRSVSGNPAIAGVVSGHSTSRGVWLLLNPLPIGVHTITFAGSYPNAGFSLSVTYRLTVA